MIYDDSAYVPAATRRRSIREAVEDERRRINGLAKDWFCVERSQAGWVAQIDNDPEPQYDENPERWKPTPLEALEAANPTPQVPTEPEGPCETCGGKGEVPNPGAPAYDAWRPCPDCQPQGDAHRHPQALSKAVEGLSGDETGTFSPDETPEDKTPITPQSEAGDEGRYYARGGFIYDRYTEDEQSIAEVSVPAEADDLVRRLNVLEDGLLATQAREIDLAIKLDQSEKLLRELACKDWSLCAFCGDVSMREHAEGCPYITARRYLDGSGE